MIVGGDFNFYYHTEPACQEILYGQGLDLIDPINQMGNWHNNSFYKNVHTQSTRSATGGYAGGAYGGMDDRFDIIFTSNDVMDGSSGIEYIANTYIADGQDGSYLAEFLIEKGYIVHGIVRRVALEDRSHRLWRIKHILKK